MSSTIFNTNSIDLMPDSLKMKAHVIAACAAFDFSYRRLVNQISNCYVLVGIDNAKEEVIDLLAWEMGIDFYDTSLTIEIKRKLVKNAYVYQFTKGTPFAVRQALQDFINQGEVQEWFEYGGEPYRFKVVASSEDIGDPTKNAEMQKVINAVKNTRSFFEGFFMYGTYESLRSFTHYDLTNYTYDQLGSGDPLNEDNASSNYGTLETTRTFTYDDLKNYTHSEIGTDVPLI